MDIEKLIEQLNDFNENHIAVLCGSGQCACGYLCDKDDCIVVRATTTLSTIQAENEKLKDQLYDGEGVNLVNYWMQQAKIEENGHRNCQAENEKLRAELEQAKRLYESEKEDFIDFACSGVPNLTPYCLNRHPDCVDERGWCRTEKCRGFSRERGQKED